MVKLLKSKPELLLDKRETKRKTYYLVKWTDQGLHDATWVTSEDLKDCGNVKKEYKVALKQSASTKARSSAHSKGTDSPQRSSGDSPVVCRQLTYENSPKLLRRDVPLSIKKLVRERKNFFVEVDWGKKPLDSKVPILTAKKSFPRKLIEFMVGRIK